MEPCKFYSLSCFYFDLQTAVLQNCINCLSADQVSSVHFHQVCSHFLLQAHLVDVIFQSCLLMLKVYHKSLCLKGLPKVSLYWRSAFIQKLQRFHDVEDLPDCFCFQINGLSSLHFPSSSWLPFLRYSTICLYCLFLSTTEMKIFLCWELCSDK